MDGKSNCGNQSIKRLLLLQHPHYLLTLPALPLPRVERDIRERLPVPAGLVPGVRHLLRVLQVGATAAAPGDHQEQQAKVLAAGDKRA